MRRRKSAIFATRAIFLLGFMLYGTEAANSQPLRSNAASDFNTNTSLSEIRNKRRVFLLVTKSHVVDGTQGNPVKALLENSNKIDATQRTRYASTYNVIARKLNKYIRKHKSITAVQDIREADFIIIFNVLEYRGLLARVYPFGELFVVVNEAQRTTNPRVAWKSKDGAVWVEDAIGDFIKALKNSRGEK